MNDNQYSISSFIFLTRTTTQTIVNGYVRTIFFKENYNTTDITSLITTFIYDNTKYKTFRLSKNKFSVGLKCWIAIPMNEETILVVGKEGLLSFFFFFFFFAIGSIFLLLFVCFFVWKFSLIAL